MYHIVSFYYCYNYYDYYGYIIIIMESFLAPFGSHVNQYSNEVLRIYFHKNSTGLLYKREKKKKKKQAKYSSTLNSVPHACTFAAPILGFILRSFVFNGSNLSLQAIYKDVNSKAYLLRLSSFLIYIYTIVHLIYFFSIQFLTVVLFLVHEVFFKSFSQNFFIQVFLLLLINNNFLWSFKNRSCFTPKSYVRFIRNILPLLIPIP